MMRMVWLVVVTLLLACGDEPPTANGMLGVGAAACSPGQALSCQCPDGSVQQQACGATGSVLPCPCGGTAGTTAGSSAATAGTSGAVAGAGSAGVLGGAGAAGAAGAAGGGAGASGAAGAAGAGA